MSICQISSHLAHFHFMELVTKHCQNYKISNNCIDQVNLITGHMVSGNAQTLVDFVNRVTSRLSARMNDFMSSTASRKNRVQHCSPKLPCFIRKKYGCLRSKILKCHSGSLSLFGHSVIVEDACLQQLTYLILIMLLALFPER